MANAIVLTYSISGSTKKIAHAIADGLGAEGVATTVHDLSAGMPDDLSRYTLIGVASPTHYYRLPAPVIAALKSLGQLDGRGGFAALTHGTYRGRALNSARRRLRAAHLTEIGTLAMLAEGHFYPYLREGCLTCPGRPDADDIETAEAFGRALALRLNWFRGGEALPAPAPRDPLTHWVYALERAVTGPRMVSLLLSEFFQADSDACTRCGLCARECPMHNIAFEKGALPTWGRNCVLCATCAAVCPREAVRSPLDWPIARAFVRYNVRRARANPAFACADVTYRMGRMHTGRKTGQHS